MNIWEFMSGSPFLTFFLAVIVGEVLCTLFKALGGKYKHEKENPSVYDEEEIL